MTERDAIQALLQESARCRRLGELYSSFLEPNMLATAATMLEAQADFLILSRDLSRDRQTPPPPRPSTQVGTS